MRLTPPDVERYFVIRKALLRYNGRQLRKRGIEVPSDDWAHSGLRDETPWPDAKTIGSFVAKNPARLKKQDLAIAESWKRAVAGYFYAVRHLKNHSIFVSEREPYRVYAAIGHQAELSVLLALTPDLYELRLLPFESRIVCSVIAFTDEYPATWPAAVKNKLLRAYRKARLRREIITAID